MIIRAAVLAFVGICCAGAGAALGEDAPRETGWTPQGLPLVNYSTDEGFGYGVRLQLIDHGTGEEQPYRYSITAQFYQTTKQIASHKLTIDAPHFLGTLNRFELEAGWSIYRF